MSDIIQVTTGQLDKPVAGEQPKPKSNIHTNFLKIPLDVSRSKGFLKFIGTPEARVWFLLHAYICRADRPGYSGVLYKKYYDEQGKLVARWDQHKMAEMLGLSEKSKSSISKYTKRLAEYWNYIVVHQEHLPMKIINVYELGYIEKNVDGGNTVEHLYMIDRIIEQNQPVYVPNKQPVGYDIEKATSFQIFE